jgi:hypothetical protein
MSVGIKFKRSGILIIVLYFIYIAVAEGKW